MVLEWSHVAEVERMCRILLCRSSCTVHTPLLDLCIPSPPMQSRSMASTCSPMSTLSSEIAKPKSTKSHDCSAACHARVNIAHALMIFSPLACHSIRSSSPALMHTSQTCRRSTPAVATSSIRGSTTITLVRKACSPCPRGPYGLCPCVPFVVQHQFKWPSSVATWQSRGIDL